LKAAKELLKRHATPASESLLIEVIFRVMEFGWRERHSKYEI